MTSAVVPIGCGNSVRRINRNPERPEIVEVHFRRDVTDAELVNFWLALKEFVPSPILRDGWALEI